MLAPVTIVVASSFTQGLFCTMIPNSGVVTVPSASDRTMHVAAKTFVTQTATNNLLLELQKSATRWMMPLTSFLLMTFFLIV